MEVRMTKIEEPGREDHPDYPVVHFTGTSRSTHEPWDPNANSNIRGLRWTGSVPFDPLMSARANITFYT
jgi:hypothetical protein